MILAVCPNPSVDTYLYMDSFKMNESSRLTNKERYAGGKGIHVAMAAAEMGEDVKLLAFWGGETGKWLKTQCEKQGIECIGPELLEDNRTCFTIKTKNQNDDTEILEAGPIISEEDFNKFIVDYKNNLKDADIISMSGSWPQNIPDNAYAELVKIAKQNSKPHILDASGIQMQLALKEKPYSIHINKTESEELFNTSNPQEVFEQVSNEIKIIALTAGKDGLFLRMNKKNIHTKVELTEIYSAVGSGDCLTAGISIAIKNNAEIIKTAQIATAYGAANCLRQDLGMLYKKDVEKLMKKIKVLEITNE